MIKVGNDWAIGIDPLNYMVARNKPKDRVRDGVTSVSYPWEGFFHTLEDALAYIRSEMIRDGLSEDMTLTDAIRVIRETDAEFRKLIEEVENPDVNALQAARAADEKILFQFMDEYKLWTNREMTDKGVNCIQRLLKDFSPVEIREGLQIAVWQYGTDWEIFSRLPGIVFNRRHEAEQSEGSVIEEVKR